MADQVLTRDGPVPVPLDYVVPASGELIPRTVRATIDGTSAAAPFYATLQVIAPSGRVMFSAISDAIAAGASADVSWFPRVNGGKGSLEVTDGTTTVPSVTEIDFTSGATVTNAGGGVADVAVSGGGGSHPIVTTFGASGGTWSMAVGTTAVEVSCIGAGGGGGGGTQDKGSNNSGGSGGGGGACYTETFRAADLTSPVTVTVGAGGLGAIGNSTPPGALGGNGGLTSFGSYLQAGGGSGGPGGSGSPQAGGGGGGFTSCVANPGLPQTITRPIPAAANNVTGVGFEGTANSGGNTGNISSVHGGAGGGTGRAGLAATSGGSSVYGGPGGGGGAGTSSTGVAQTAGVGGAPASVALGGGGAAGGSGASPTSGGNGSAGPGICGGGGGGGGSTSAATVHGAGGGSGGVGAGGGGGGNSDTSQGGNGGPGGDGVCVVIEY